MNIIILYFIVAIFGSVVVDDLTDQLLTATLESDVDEILALVRKGADPNIMIALRTPLIAVCETGNIEAVKELIRLGASPDFGDSSQFPILSAVESKNLELVRTLLDCGCSSQEHNATLLAVYNGPFEIVKLLVDHFGFDLNDSKIGEQVEMLLTESCQRGDPAIFEYIIQRVPHKLVWMGLRWRIYEICFHWFNDKIWAVLAASGWLKDLVNCVRDPVLIYAMKLNMSYHAERLIRNGVDVKLGDIYGNQALHVVQSAGLIGNLIMAGADLEARNEKGQTPLITALEEQRWDVARALVRFGANPNVVDIIGCKPLVMSIPIVTSMKDRASVFMILLQHPRLDLYAIAEEAIQAVFALSDSGLRNTGFASIIKAELDFRRSISFLFCGNQFDPNSTLHASIIPSEIVHIILHNLLFLNRLNS